MLAAETTYLFIGIYEVKHGQQALHIADNAAQLRIDNRPNQWEPCGLFISFKTSFPLGRNTRFISARAKLPSG
jgi:hypothetical protein